MPKLNQMSCVSPVEAKGMVAAPKASLPLDLSLTALLSARGQNVIRNTFLSEGLTSAESPGISEAVQLCKYLPVSVRQSHARFHFSALSSYVVLSSISFHLKSMHRVWNTAVEHWDISEDGNFIESERTSWENQRLQTEPFPTPAFYLGISTQCLIPFGHSLLVFQKSTSSWFEKTRNTKLYT